MPKYRVHLMTTASTSIEVDADDPESAIEAAFNQRLPYADAFAGFSLGEWTTGSELFPAINKPEHDAELIP